MELSVATTVNDVGLANILKGMLESNGVPAVLRDKGAETTLPTETLTAIDVMVRPEDLSAALELLADAEDHDCGFEEDEA